MLRWLPMGIYSHVFQQLAADFTFTVQSPEEQGLRFREAFRAYWMCGRPADHWDELSRQDWTRLTTDCWRALAS